MLFLPTSQKSRGEKRKATEQLKPFPKELGQNLISDGVKEMDTAIDKFQFEDDTSLHKLNQLARGHYLKNFSSVSQQLLQHGVLFRKIGNCWI